MGKNLGVFVVMGAVLIVATIGVSDYVHLQDNLTVPPRLESAHVMHEGGICDSSADCDTGLHCSQVSHRCYATWSRVPNG
jgi:hypothetical protein